jgi:hypothetical protein
MADAPLLAPTRPETPQSSDSDHASEARYESGVEDAMLGGLQGGTAEGGDDEESGDDGVGAEPSELGHVVPSAVVVDAAGDVAAIGAVPVVGSVVVEAADDTAVAVTAAPAVSGVFAAPAGHFPLPDVGRMRLAAERRMAVVAVQLRNAGCTLNEADACSAALRGLVTINLRQEFREGCVKEELAVDKEFASAYRAVVGELDFVRKQIAMRARNVAADRSLVPPGGARDVLMDFFLSEAAVAESRAHNMTRLGVARFGAFDWGTAIGRATGVVPGARGVEASPTRSASLGASQSSKAAMAASPDRPSTVALGVALAAERASGEVVGEPPKKK